MIQLEGYLYRVYPALYHCTSFYLLHFLMLLILKPKKDSYALNFSLRYPAYMFRSWSIRSFLIVCTINLRSKQEISTRLITSYINYKCMFFPCNFYPVPTGIHAYTLEVVHKKPIWLGRNLSWKGGEGAASGVRYPGGDILEPLATSGGNFHHLRMKAAVLP